MVFAEDEWIFLEILEDWIGERTEISERFCAKMRLSLVFLMGVLVRLEFINAFLPGVCHLSLRSRRMASALYSSEEENKVLPTDLATVGGINDDSRRIQWKAQVKSSVRVKEGSGKRTVNEYMALPASQYSVLASKQIERLSDSKFKAVLGKLNFFGTVIIPTLYVDVNVIPEEYRSEIVVKRAETTGSPQADAISGTFKISALNLVSAGQDDKGRPMLTSDTKLKIDVIVPEDAKVPLKMITSGGNFIIQSSLNVIVPTFVRILAADFKRWSEGDDSRGAVEGASL